MASKSKQTRKVSTPELMRQIARKVKLAYVVVDVATNRLKVVRATRAEARAFVKDAKRNGARNRSLAVRRVDLRVAGLRA